MDTYGSKGDCNLCSFCNPRFNKEKSVSQNMNFPLWRLSNLEESNWIVVYEKDFHLYNSFQKLLSKRGNEHLIQLENKSGTDKKIFAYK